ncbi:glycosyltransferase family 4 protein [Rhodovulum adriaticum]|nr:glycosyltransferase family 4 protein [Rhodovulum adriaticum]
MTRKLLFAHDDKVTLDQDNRPVSYNYTRGLVERYRYMADHVTFAVRGDAREPVAWFSDATLICLPDMKHGRNLAKMRKSEGRVASLVADHDLVVARLPSLIGSWALKSAGKMNKPVLVEFVGCPWDALWNHSLKGKLVAPYFRAKNRRLMRRTTHALYVTETFLQKRYPSSGEQIACSDVETVMADRRLFERRLRRLNGIREGDKPITLGTVANLDVPYKGHDLVIRALAALGEARHRFVYKLIGPGEPSRLQNLATALGVVDQIQFAGPCPRENIPQALDGIDIYLQPSRQEGLPRAVIEAMARGCVVIGARTGGIPELLVDPWIVPRGDWRQIAARLRTVETLPLAQAASRNYEKAHEFDMDVLARKRRDFYDVFLADHGLMPAIGC